MKLKRISLITLLTSLCLISGCGNSNNSNNGEAIVNFHTGYEELKLESQKPKNGKISKPEITDSAYTVYDYYSDPLFEKKFDFNSNITGTTNVYVKIIKGNGSENNPYIVESGLNLNVITHFGSEVSGYVEVTKDLTVISKYTEDYALTTFNGVFYGNGNKITFDANEINNTGIFYKIGEDAKLSSFSLAGNINGVKASTGAVVNYNYGLIEEVTTYGSEFHTSNGYSNGVFLQTKFDEEDIELVIEDFGTVGVLETLNKGGAGGISGTNYGTIRNCTNKMRVSATIGGGGIAGINYGDIENCYNQGAIGTTGTSAVNSSHIRDHLYDFSYIGGMAGANYGSIKQCANLNQVFVARLPWIYNNAPAGQSDYINRIRVGGIAGANFGEYDEDTQTYDGGIIEECVNYGRIHGDMQVGGIAGYSNSYIANCFSSSYIGGRNSIGTIVGWQPGDKEGDHVGIVTNCIGFMRINAGGSSTVVDINENQYNVTPLTNASSSSSSNVYDHFKLAKYATNSVYHNNSGNINPIDPLTNENTSVSSTATMGEKAYNKVGFADGIETGIWHYEETKDTTAMIGINRSWQVYLNVRLAWQNKTITVVNGDSIYSISGIAGIDYLNTILEEEDGKYTSDWDSNLSGVIPGRGISSISVEAGKKIVWVTEKGNIKTQWDGLLRDNITIYPMVVDVTEEA